MDFGNGAEVAEKEDFFPAESWTLTETQDYFLPLSKVESDIKFYEIDLHGNKLTEKLLSDDAQNLFKGKTNWTQSELIGWLADKITDRFITPEDFAEFTRRALAQLINEKNFSLDELVRMRFSIRKLLAEKIEILKDRAYKQSGLNLQKFVLKKISNLLSIRQLTLLKNYIEVQSNSANIFIRQSAI